MNINSNLTGDPMSQENYRRIEQAIHYLETHQDSKLSSPPEEEPGTQTFFELGCGDGRVAVAMALAFGCRVVSHMTLEALLML